VDPSLLSGLTINIFGESEQKLPPITEVGEIFRGHRLGVSYFNDKPQLAGGGRGKGFSFVLIKKDGTPFFATKSCTFTESDQKRIKGLKVWWDSTQAERASYIAPVLPKNTYLKKIEQIGPNNASFDLICQVIRVFPIEGNKGSQRIKLMVWDGSGQNQFFNTTLESFPPAKSNIQVMHSLQSPIGGIAHVIVWNVKLFELFERGHITEGRWIQLKFASSKIYMNQIEIKIGSESTIQILENNNPVVVDIIKSYQKRYEEQQKKDICLATIDMHSEVPVSTIAEILVFPQATYKFRCRGLKLKSYSPSVQHFTSPYCVFCDKTLESPNGDTVICAGCKLPASHFIYRLQLMLEDGTGSLEASVFKEEGIKFFNRLPPCNLFQNTLSLNLIQSKLKKLIDPNASLDCCIKSYLDNSKQNRLYQIFDTEIVM